MATSKEPIIYKLTGKNVKIVVDGETLSRKIEDAEERKIIKERVIAYNNKPLVKEKKELIKLMTVAKVEAKKEKATTVKKTGVKAPSKLTKKAEEVVEKAPELTKAEQIEAAKQLLQENNYTVNEKQAPRQFTRRGEH